MGVARTRSPRTKSRSGDTRLTSRATASGLAGPHPAGGQGKDLHQRQRQRVGIGNASGGNMGVTWALTLTQTTGGLPSRATTRRVDCSHQ